jgi:hypothetical protein
VNSPHDATGCNLAQRQPAARRRPGACPLAWRITPHQSPAVYLSASNGPRKTPNLAKRLRELRFASQTSLASARLETEASQSCHDGFYWVAACTMSGGNAIPSVLATS